MTRTCCQQETRVTTVTTGILMSQITGCTIVIQHKNPCTTTITQDAVERTVKVQMSLIVTSYYSLLGGKLNSLAICTVALHDNADIAD